MSAVLPGLGATRDCTWARILSVENRMCSSCCESFSSSVSNSVTLSAFPSFSTVYWRNGYGGCVSRNRASPLPLCKPPNTGGCYASQSLVAVGMIIVSQARLSRGRVWPARLTEDGRAAGGLRTCLALVNEEEANFLNSSSRLLKD